MLAWKRLAKTKGGAEAPPIWQVDIQCATRGQARSVLNLLLLQ
jgi:hypothetical protein